MPTVKLISAIALLVGLGYAGGAAAQEDCPRGDLDSRFCDRDGDLVAGTPTDESELLDPDMLIFAYTPVEHPTVCTSVVSTPAPTHWR